MTPTTWNNAQVSAIGVLLAEQRLLEYGYGVARPVVQEPWDLLVYKGRRAWRVEVKATANARDSRVDCRRGHDKRLRYSPQHVDAVCAVHVLRGIVLFVPARWLNGRRTLWFSTFSDFASPDLLLKCKPLQTTAS